MADIKSMLNDRQKMWTALSFSFLAVIAFTLLYKYDYGNYVKIRIRASEVARNRARLDTLAGFKAIIDGFTAELVPGSTMDRLMVSVSSAAKDKGVIVNAVKPIDPERISGYGIARVSVEGKASYRDLAGFISGLSGSREHLFIESISLKHSGPAMPGVGRAAPSSAQDPASDGGTILFSAVVTAVGRET